MTNEEALSILHCPDAYGGIYGEKCGEALNMAMEALKREPCEDCVSREAVLDGLAIIAKAKAKSDAQKSLMGRVMFFYGTLTIRHTTAKNRTVDSRC